MSDNEVTPLVASRAASAIITAQEQEIERLRNVARHQYLNLEHQSVKIWAMAEELSRIHALLLPDNVTTEDGRVFSFRDPDPHTRLRLLTDHIKAIPKDMLEETDKLMRMQAFVRAWDAWNAADPSDLGRSEDAMMAAREAVGKIDP